MSQDKSWLENNFIGVVAGSIALILVLSIVFNYWMAPMIFEQNRQAGEEIAQETIDADKALQDYREFRQLYYDIQSAREQLETYEQREQRFHETWPDGEWKENRDSRETHSRLNARIDGQKNQISNLVAEYNAMSADSTTSLYQCHLPYNIDEKLFISDASGIEYKEGADKGEAPENPSESCQYSDVPDEALNSQ